MNNTGKTAAIILGVLAVACAAALAALAVTNRPAGLSQGNMEKTVEAAEKAKKEGKRQAEPEEGEESEGHTKAIAAFQVTKAGAAQVKGTGDGAQEAGTGSSEYLCGYSSDRLMTEADVQELKQGTYSSLPQGMGIIRMVVNELYAKHGYQFGNEEIQAYFDQQEWYQNIPARDADMNGVVKKMTDTERANVEFLSPYIEE